MKRPTADHVNLGLIGLGNVGSGIAKRLLDHGYQPHVYVGKAGEGGDQRLLSPVSTAIDEPRLHLILGAAAQEHVPKPVTEAAFPVNADDLAHSDEEDFSAVLWRMEELAGSCYSDPGHEVIRRAAVSYIR
jgi:hypothetical protein